MQKHAAASQNKVIKIDFEPIGKRGEIPPGITLLEAAQISGIEIVSLCGGAGLCDGCRLRLLQGSLSDVTPHEKEFFSVEELEEGWRLACQAVALTDVKINLPPESLTTPQRLQIEGQEVVLGEDRVIRYIDIQLEKPTLNSLESDMTRIINALVDQGIPEPIYSFPILQSLSEKIRVQEWKARIVLRYRNLDNQAEIVAVLPVETILLGLAVDIGTTKIAAYLINMHTGKTVAKMGMMNPQISYGEDVVSRIAYANVHDNGRRILQKKLMDTINEIIIELCNQTGGSLEQVVESVIVGNTVIHHLFAGLPVQQLGLLPYVPTITGSLEILACELGLNIAPGAYIYLPPNIAGYVGADHVAMVLATQVYQTDDITIALDIGTNTEISLASDGIIRCCSCASGPAFEGAHIHDGMRAAAGSIERVQIIDNTVRTKTIGEQPPIGICGSGIIDAVAEMYKANIIDYRGVFVEGANNIQGKGKEKHFVLVPGEKTAHGNNIIVTRNDINEIQLAKAAIRSGINLLLKDAELLFEQIDKFIIAGAFGSFLDVKSAMTIGMFPSLPIDRFNQVGNAAGTGARQLLLSVKQRDICTRFARRMKYIELTECLDFQDTFVKSMYFQEFSK